MVLIKDFVNFGLQPDILAFGANMFEFFNLFLLLVFVIKGRLKFSCKGLASSVPKIFVLLLYKNNQTDIPFYVHIN